MKTLVSNESLHDPYETHEVISWDFHFSTEYIFEIATSEVEKVLPPGIFTKEVRPGVSCMGVGVTDFVDGNLGYIPAFTELTVSIHVSPDLSKSTVVPNFAIYVVNVTSTANEFLDFTHNIDHIPIYNPNNLHVEIQKERHATTASDESGQIFDIQNIHPNPVFERKCFPCQVITLRDDYIYLANVDVNAETFQHQMKGNPGKLFNHPFFNGLPVEQCTQCYMQFLTAPVCNGVMNWRKPIRIR